LFTVLKLLGEDKPKQPNNDIHSSDNYAANTNTSSSSEQSHMKQQPPPQQQQPQQPQQQQQQQQNSSSSDTGNSDSSSATAATATDTSTTDTAAATAVSTFDTTADTTADATAADATADTGSSTSGLSEEDFNSVLLLLQLNFQRADAPTFIQLWAPRLWRANWFKRFRAAVKGRNFTRSINAVLVVNAAVVLCQSWAELQGGARQPFHKQVTAI
jgi:hypothetical protein